MNKMNDTVIENFIVHLQRNNKLKFKQNVFA
jgi:hypothetical protein